MIEEICEDLHSRSLLSGETLEQDAGVLVDRRLFTVDWLGRGGLQSGAG